MDTSDRDNIALQVSDDVSTTLTLVQVASVNMSRLGLDLEAPPIPLPTKVIQNILRDVIKHAIPYLNERCDHLTACPVLNLDRYHLGVPLPPQVCCDLVPSRPDMKHTPGRSILSSARTVYLSSGVFRSWLRTGTQLNV